VSPRFDLDTEARGKILCPRRGSNYKKEGVRICSEFNWLKMGTSNEPSGSKEGGKFLD
jgi:hypothetical protein